MLVEEEAEVIVDANVETFPGSSAATTKKLKEFKDQSVYFKEAALNILPVILIALILIILLIRWLLK